MAAAAAPLLNPSARAASSAVVAAALPLGRAVGSLGTTQALSHELCRVARCSGDGSQPVPPPPGPGAAARSTHRGARRIKSWRTLAGRAGREAEALRRRARLRAEVAIAWPRAVDPLRRRFVRLFHRWFATQNVL
jgi:hypothetical protein